MNFKIPFSGRALKYTQSEVNKVIEVMNDDDGLTQGKYLKGFQEKFSSFNNAKYSFAVNTATSALELSAQLTIFEKDTEVVIPSHTFTSSAYPFLKRGAKIKWADIDRETRVMSLKTLQDVVTEKTKVVVFPHLYGYLGEIEEVASFCKNESILLVEDAAQSIGVKANGNRAGNFGDFGVFSFHSHKNVTTLGEGGMLTVKSEEVADIIPKLRHNGHCTFGYEREFYWQPAMGNVDIIEYRGKTLLPNNYCLGEVECALGVELLDRVDDLNNAKRIRAINVIDSLSEYSDQLIFHKVDNDRHNYHLLVAEVANGKRDELIKFLAYEKGIQCVVQYYPLNRYDFYKKLGLGDANCPQADGFYDNMISFPFQGWLTDDEISYMVDSIKEGLKKIFND